MFRFHLSHWQNRGKYQHRGWEHLCFQHQRWSQVLQEHELQNKLHYKCILPEDQATVRQLSSFERRLLDCPEREWQTNKVRIHILDISSVCYFLSSSRFSKTKKFKTQQTAGNMTVKFTSNRKSEAAGARCSVQCAKEAPTPAPTPAPGHLRKYCENFKTTIYNV